MIWRELLEKRSNPDKNPRSSDLASLLNYRGQKDIFVSFTSGFDSQKTVAYGMRGNGQKSLSMKAGVRGTTVKSNKGQHKIGINPRNSFETPMGVYTYPVDYIIEYSREKGRLTAPYTGKTEWKFLYVVRRNTAKFIDSSTDIKPYQKVLTEWMEETIGEEAASAMVGEGITSSSTSNPQQIFWNISRLFADRYAENTQGEPTAVWNYIMRHIGVDVFIDDSGAGIIHNSEPTQAVFFTPRAFNVVDVIEGQKTDNLGDFKRIRQEIEKHTLNVSAVNPAILIYMAGRLEIPDIEWLAPKCGPIVRRFIAEGWSKHWPRGYNNISVELVDALRKFGPIPNKVLLDEAVFKSFPFSDMPKLLGHRLSQQDWQIVISKKTESISTLSAISKLSTTTADFIDEGFVKALIFLSSVKNLPIADFQLIMDLMSNNGITPDDTMIKSIFAAFPVQTIQAFGEDHDFTFEDWYRAARLDNHFSITGDIIPLDFAKMIIKHDTMKFSPNDDLINRLIDEDPKFMLDWLPTGASVWTNRDPKLQDFMLHNIAYLAAKNPSILRFVKTDIKPSPNVIATIWREVVRGSSAATATVSWAIRQGWITQDDFLKYLRKNPESEVGSREHDNNAQLAQIGERAQDYWNDEQINPEIVARSALILGKENRVPAWAAPALFRIAPEVQARWAGKIESSEQADALYHEFIGARVNDNILENMSPAALWYAVKKGAPEIYDVASENTQIAIIRGALQEDGRNALMLNDPTGLFKDLPRDYTEWTSFVNSNQLGALTCNPMGQGPTIRAPLATILLRGYPEDFKGHIKVDDAYMRQLLSQNPTQLACMKLFVNEIPHDIMVRAQVATVDQVFRNHAKTRAVLDMTYSKFITPPLPETLAKFQLIHDQS